MANAELIFNLNRDNGMLLLYSIKFWLHIPVYNLIMAITWQGQGILALGYMFFHSL